MEGKRYLVILKPLVIRAHSDRQAIEKALSELEDLLEVYPVNELEHGMVLERNSLELLS